MFQQAECESLCLNCHHEYIIVFALLQRKALCVVRLELSGSIIVSPASLYMIGFELIQ